MSPSPGKKIPFSWNFQTKSKETRLDLKDAFSKVQSSTNGLTLVAQKPENFEEIAITPVNSRTICITDSGASINLLPHSIYKKLGLEALTPTRMTLALATVPCSHRWA
ncbi:reverse transcriptase domain-containing protein, chloroplastic [Tanacetum coccineum]